LLHWHYDKTVEKTFLAELFPTNYLFSRRGIAAHRNGRNTDELLSYELFCGNLEEGGSSH
jgi:hypothetical protein